MSTSVSPVQPSNADEPSEVSEAGVRTEASDVQLENADEPIDVRLSQNLTVSMPVHPENADEPIVFALSRFTAPSMLTHRANADEPIVEILSKSIFWRFTPGHPLNASLPTAHPTARLITRFVNDEQHSEWSPTLSIDPAKDTLPGLGFLFP